MKTPNTDAAIRKWLAEAPPPAPPRERVAAILRKRTREAYKAKDMGLLPTSTDLKVATSCGAAATHRTALTALGAQGILHKGKTRWALL